MSADTISIDGYGINLFDTFYELQDENAASSLVYIALKRILNEDLDDGLIELVDDASGRHFVENHNIDVYAGVIDSDRTYIYVPSVMPFQKSPVLEKSKLERMITIILHDILLKALQTDDEFDDYIYQDKDQQQFENDFAKLDLFFEELHDGGRGF